MTKPNNGGPAFPVATAKAKWELGGDGETHLVSEQLQIHPGLSLRDWFAGMALQGLLARCVGPIDLDLTSGSGDIKLIQTACYNISDALLLQREKECVEP